jgi:hypothetical protein
MLHGKIGSLQNFHDSFRGDLVTYKAIICLFMCVKPTWKKDARKRACRRGSVCSCMRKYFFFLFFVDRVDFEIFAVQAPTDSRYIYVRPVLCPHTLVVSSQPQIRLIRFVKPGWHSGGCLLSEVWPQEVASETIIYSFCPTVRALTSNRRIVLVERRFRNAGCQEKTCGHEWAFVRYRHHRHNSVSFVYST